MTHYENKSSKELRAGMGEGLVEAGRKNENVVALSADVKGSVKMDGFAKEFPERFIQCGIAEANMVGIAAGLSLCGKVPFIGGFAEFVTGRVYDQIRQVVCYSNKNVKICGSHAGISLGEDGATHQTMEDIALMKVLPNMTVLVPADFNQAKAATLAAAEHVGPVYLRLGRSKMPCFLPEGEKFEIGKGIVERHSPRNVAGDDNSIAVGNGALPILGYSVLIILPAIAENVHRLVAGKGQMCVRKNV